MVSILDVLSGGVLLMADVRQSGGSPLGRLVVDYPVGLTSRIPHSLSWTSNATGESIDMGTSIQRSLDNVSAHLDPCRLISRLEEARLTSVECTSTCGVDGPINLAIAHFRASGFA